ncbi:MAG: branched-chain amino acid ABC transporter permease [Deltaproteobacteria bacterium HGW-Deltaproteobacteria-17]|nr:MAG: branched-chain amino acid ABC transporter permease [Deltaproteobacteria bacterium HGW-Deltaproteobacteria-17]
MRSLTTEQPAGSSGPAKGGRWSAFGDGLRRNRLVLLVSIFLITLPLWETPLSDLTSVRILYHLRLVGIYTIVAVGLNLLIGYAGQVSLGHAAFFGIGAYTTAILTTRAGWPPWVGIPAAMLIAGAIGLVLGSIVLRLKGHYLAMATLALGIIVFVLFRELHWLTLGTDGINYIPPLSLPGLKITSRAGQYYFIWTIALLVLLFCSNVIDSRVGRALRALHHSEVAAAAMGVDVALYKVRVFTLSAILAGLAGALFAHIQTFINPSAFYIDLSIMLVTMVVVGGMSSIWGAVAGAATITFIRPIVGALPRWFEDVPDWVKNYSNYEALVFGLILVLTMVFMPSGITRSVTDLLKQRRSPFNNPFRKRRWE